MARIRFLKKGAQREYLDLVIKRLNCLSLRGLLQFGIHLNYSTLKNYYTERRLLPADLFEDLNHLAKLNKKSLKIELFQDSWGQVLGGKISRRKKKD